MDWQTDRNSKLFQTSGGTFKNISKDFRKISHPKPEILGSWVNGYAHMGRHTKTAAP